MADLVPFGKYRGKPVEDLMADTSYVEWLSSQDWFRNKYGSVYNIVVQNSPEPAETPVHNAMQIKFLDEDYRLKFVLAVEQANGNPPASVLSAKSATLREWVEVAKQETIDNFDWPEGRDLDGFRNSSWCPYGKYSTARVVELLHEAVLKAQEQLAKRIASVRISIDDSSGKFITFERPHFEHAKEDFSGYRGRSTKTAPADVHFVARYAWSIEGGTTRRRAYHRWDMTIELKPCVGDDYPAVLRQMRRSDSTYLMIGSWTGMGISFEDFKRFMANEGITVVMEADVDNLVLPPFERVYTPG